jgi:monomeric sarcosine oxidase
MTLTLPIYPVQSRETALTTIGRLIVTVRADLVVVGAGLAGAAAAYAAAGRGLNVVVLEAFGPAHRNGSSHGSARIFRRAYPDPLYVRLTGQSGRRWRALEAAAGESLLTLTGGLDFGNAREPARLHAVLTECGVPAELLAEEAAAERWPLIDFRGAGQVMYHEDAGVLDPDRAIAAMLRLATANGADVRFDTPVTALAQAPGGGAVARTGSEAFTAPVAVVAAGPWIAPLLGGLVKLPTLTVTQQQVFHFAPAKGREAEPWPVFIGFDGGGYRYGLPGGRDGGVPGAVKIGEHDPGRATTAAGRDFRIDPASRDRVRAFVTHRLPGLDPEPINEASCLYTWTANEDFILDRPGGGPFVVASPCSGHGAKFAPLLGEVIADLAAGAPAPDPRFTLAAHLGQKP